jgi:hypothetical protein
MKRPARSAFLLATLPSLLAIGPSCADESDAAESGANEAGETSATSEVGGDDSTGDPAGSAGHVLASVVITDAGRTTYVQVVPELAGHITNDAGVEIPGNGVLMVSGRDVLVGLAEEPTWVKYTVRADGSFEEAGRMSLMSYGLTAIDFGNTLVDATTAVSISSDALAAIVWNPETMTVTGTIDLPHLAEEGFDLENWTTAAHDGLVYAPARWADWDNGVILPKVVTTILDPKALSIVGVADDDRCASGGHVVFDADGYAYVMGDGRNYSIQMFAHAAGEPVPENCILRIAPGETDFEEDWVVAVPSITGGLEAITELATAVQGSGVALAKMFYPDELPDGVEPIDFEFWGLNAHRMWRIELGDTPTAVPVEGAPLSAIGFAGAASAGLYYQGESEDGGGTTTVYVVDPQANTMAPLFTMDGYFYGTYPLPAP